MFPFGFPFSIRSYPISTVVPTELIAASSIRFGFTPNLSSVGLPRSLTDTALGSTYYGVFQSSRYLPSLTNNSIYKVTIFVQRTTFSCPFGFLLRQPNVLWCVNVMIIFKSKFPSHKFSCSDSGIIFISDPPSALIVMDTGFSNIADISVVFVVFFQFIPCAFFAFPSFLAPFCPDSFTNLFSSCSDVRSHFYIQYFRASCLHLLLNHNGANFPSLLSHILID